MDKSQVEDYLARIGAQRPARADLEALIALQRAHLATVPFENLSIHLGEPIVLTEAALLAKLVDRRRGGFCYELNGAFAALLTALGYRVSLLSARVVHEDKAGPPFDHMALRVDLDEPWLVDVGFGRSAEAPLRLNERGEQSDGAGTFQLVEHGDDLDLLMNGGVQYRLDLRPYDLSDFAPTCWWQSTSADSHFSRFLTCSLLTLAGRVTLSGTRLYRTTANGEREQSELTESEALDTYRTVFGISLERLPVLAVSEPPRPQRP
ncbi:arylamine N-acetyltransferase [Kitasatospora sp. NPDC050543]|uniref:arylamine N-acetyltransferase n=1 Tax=Kitasatospora sp. NPDC050543 TaxID=3364054 RepID=UPI0037938469